MTNNNRENIYRISNHSNLSEDAVEKSLIEYVYNDKQQWNWFIKLFLLSVGVGFATAGIIFFFAYNWTGLHKFAKLGIAEGILIITAALTFIPTFSTTTKNIVLTGASMLVGVLFAVFGQIYQTGANAYDFFLGWTVFITLWVVVSNFPPVWLLYILLINTTLFLYGEQVANYWEPQTVYTIHFCLNVIFLAATLAIQHVRNDLNIPAWFSNTVAFIAVFFATTGVIVELFDYYEDRTFILLITSIFVYSLGVYYAINQKSIFYLAVISFSLIIIVSAIIIRTGEDIGMFFLVCLFIIGSVTAVIKGLLSLHSSWSHE